MCRGGRDDGTFYGDPMVSRSMTHSKGTSGFLLGVGALLIVEGIWGMFSDQVFGLLTINLTRAAIHLALGIGAIIAARRGRPLGYLTTLGGILLAVAVLWSIPASRDLLTNILAVNQAGAVVNAVLGMACFLAGSASGRRLTHEELERDPTRPHPPGATPAH
jgi:hypothetical protein